MNNTKLNALLEYLGLECEVTNQQDLMRHAELMGSLISSSGIKAVEALNLPTIEPKYKIKETVGRCKDQVNNTSRCYCPTCYAD